MISTVCSANQETIIGMPKQNNFANNGPRSFNSGGNGEHKGVSFVEITKTFGMEIDFIHRAMTCAKHCTLTSVMGKVTQ